MVGPSDIPLPYFLDPLLSYLSSVLPPPVYQVVFSLLSNLLAILASLLSISSALINSESWSLQAVLPPLITMFVAYLAILSIYRTTVWMLRSTLFFIKWSVILAALFAGAGYLIGQQNNGVQVGLAWPAGIITSLGGLMLDALSKQNQGQESSQSRSKSNSQSSRSRPNKANPNPNPKSWESWSQHKAWQEGQKQQTEAGQVDGQKIMADIVGAVRSSGWWDMAKSVMDGGSSEKSDKASGGKDKRQGKDKTNTR